MDCAAVAQEPAARARRAYRFLDLPQNFYHASAAEPGAHARQAVLTSTHDLDLAMRSATALADEPDGSIAQGSPEDLVLSGQSAHFSQANHAIQCAYRAI
jgi:hypothetical protein